ncbi:MAG: pyridoxamine 5'-phosphate oxidase family protein, partial [Pseudomonadota bacterium]|nr:pyridoxamine 5'-phosphate oxidase family protein [Pseudomonadota bacterium]
MNDLSPKNTISTIEAFEAIYGEPLPQSLVKEIDYISDHYRSFIEKSPFIVLARVAEVGRDCSPGGDPVGLVR